MQQASAQDAPPAAEPAPVAAPAPEPVAPPVPAPESTTPPAPEPVVTATPEAAPPAEEPPAEPPPAAEEPKPLTIGIWTHIGTYLKGPESKLNHVSSNGELDLLFSAQLVDGFSVAGNLVGGFGAGYGGMSGPVTVMDLQARMAIDDAFNVWVGRMLVPSDRANFSGFWFAAPWFYPGFHFDGPPVGPRQGPQGRNNGVTIWGQAAGGTFKYYAGAYDLHNTTGSALFSGRLNLSLINPEPGYFHSSTYYGSKDVLAIGIAGQYQKDGSGGDDYSEFNADILFEKNLGEGGVLDLEGAFYKYMGDGEPVDYSFLLLASWMTADKVGIGHIQPLVRFQSAKTTDVASGAIPPDETSNIIEGQVGYVIDSYATRLALGVLYQKAGDVIEDTQLYVGVQLQK